MEKSILRSLPLLIIVLVLTYSCKDASLPSGVDSENNLSLEIVVDNTVADNIIAGDEFEITGSVQDSYGNIVNDIVVQAKNTEGINRDGKFIITLNDLETKGEQSILVTAEVDTIDVKEAEVNVFVSPNVPSLDDSNLIDPQSQVKTVGDSLRIGIELMDKYGNEITSDDYNPNDDDAVGIFVLNDQFEITTDWVNNNYQSARIGLDDIGSEEFKLKIGGEEKQDPLLIYTVPNVVIVNQPAEITTAGIFIMDQNENDGIQVQIEDDEDKLVEQNDIIIHACVASEGNEPGCKDGQGIVSEDNDFNTRTDNGVATFDEIKLIKSGEYRLLFFYKYGDGDNERKYSGLSNEFSIEPAEYSTFEETVKPQDEEVVGEPLGGDNPPAVQLKDRYNNTVAEEGVTIKVGLLQGGGDTVGFPDGVDTEVTTNGNGEAVFPGLIINEAGEYKLTYKIEDLDIQESMKEFTVTSSEEDDGNENDDGDGDDNGGGDGNGG